MFGNYPPVHQVSTIKGPHGDALNHCVNYKYFRNPTNSINSTHELTHGINSQIRNKFRMPGFYCLEDREIHLPEASGKKSDCIKFIPTDMRYGRYNLYVVGSEDWESSPLYLLDEFVAYLNGAKTMLFMNGKEGKGTDYLFGAVEFAVYGIATVLAHPRQNIEDFVRWLCVETEQVYLAGRANYPWAQADKCYAQLKARPEFSKFFSAPDINWVM